MRYATCGLVTVTLVAVAAFAQTPSPETAEPRFEVASIKPSPPNKSPYACAPPTCYVGFFKTLPGRFEGTSMSVLDLVATAYQMSQRRIVAPAWTQTERYDILATNARLFPSGARAGAPSDDESAMTIMLQHLLQERFAFRSHREMRPTDVYILTKARDDGKLGPQLVSSSAPMNRDECGAGSAFLPAKELSCGVLNFWGATGRMARGTWEELGLAQSFFSSVDRPVLDETGLTGWFEMKLEWSDDPAQFEKPSIFTALRQQLGLKLDSAKRPMEFLVIDSVERPTPD